MNGFPANTRFNDIRRTRRSLGGVGPVWALLALLGVLIALAGCTGGAPAAGSAAPTATPQPVRVPDKVVADGVVVPALEASLSMPVSGIVGEVLVAEGEQVAAGQPLLRLRQARLEAAVAQAEAGVARSQAQLDELTAARGPRSSRVPRRPSTRPRARWP